MSGLSALLPGTTADGPPAPPVKTILFTSIRKLLFCFFDPWHSRQLWAKIGYTSRSKSTDRAIAGGSFEVSAARAPPGEHSATVKMARKNEKGARGIGQEYPVTGSPTIPAITGSGCSIQNGISGSPRLERSRCIRFFEEILFQIVGYWNS